MLFLQKTMNDYLAHFVNEEYTKYKFQIGRTQSISKNEEITIGLQNYIPQRMLIRSAGRVQ